MKTKILLALMYLATMATYVLAQNPGFNYQAVLRDAQGVVVPNANIMLFITLTNGPDGPVLYRENHALLTNDLGILNTTIGRGTVEDGDYADIVGVSDLNIKLEAEIPGEPNVVDIGNSSVSATPYALYGRDEDSDPDNEMQTLSLEGDSLKISGTPGVSLAEIKSPWSKIDDGYELELDNNARSAELMLNKISATTEGGLNLENDLKSHTIHPDGSMMSDGQNNGEEKFGYLEDHLNEEEIMKIADRLKVTDGIVRNAYGTIERGPEFLFVEALTDIDEGFTFRCLGDTDFASWQLNGECVQKFFLGGRALGDFFYDGDMDAVGMDFFNPSGVATGGMIVNATTSLAAFSTFGVLGAQNLVTLMSANTAGGDYITFGPSGQLATRSTSISELGGVLLTYDNDGTEKIRIGCDANGEAGIWFDGEQVVAPSGSKVESRKISDEGTFQLVNGEAMVYCNHEFTEIADPGNMVVQLTPMSINSKGLAVIEKFPGGFKVRELLGGTGTYEVDWVVMSREKATTSEVRLPALTMVENPSFDNMKSVRDLVKKQ